ncbi:MAG TPA: hypothetical protein VHA35_11390 [Dongiaceae bacterium]|nr:hypothetical protein [Dongiaceae bacterium]
MGLLEPHGRRRGRDGQARLRTVTVANLAQARAALNAGRAAGERVRLQSEKDAVPRYGVLYFVKMTELLAAEFPELKPDIAVDCGDRADLAHAAMRAGLRNVVFHGDPRAAEKLAGIAAELRIRFESHPASSRTD